MDVVYLLLACLFFSVQSVFQKFFQKNTRGGFGVTLWNQFVMYVSMTLWLSVTAGFVKEFSLTSLVYAVLYAVVGLTSSVSALFAMGCGKISVVSLFSLLGGMLLPFFYGVLILGEDVTVWKALGILVLVVALLPPVLVGESEGNKGGGNRRRFVSFCLLVFFGNGLTGVFSKAHQMSPDAVETDSFVLLCALVSLVFAGVLLMAQVLLSVKRGERSPVKSVFYEIGKTPMTGKLFLFLLGLMVCYALCNGFGNIFSLRCALTMDSSVQFPLLSGVVILLAAVLGRVCFREKITKANGFSLLLTMVGIGLFMMPA